MVRCCWAATRWRSRNTPWVASRSTAIVQQRAQLVSRSATSTEGPMRLPSIITRMVRDGLSVMKLTVSWSDRLTEDNSLSVT